MEIDGVGNLCLYCMEEMGNSSRCPHCGQEEGSLLNLYGVLPAGSILAGHYLVGCVLSEDGFTITYLGYDLDLHIKRVIKENFPIGMCLRVGSAVRVNTVSKQEPYQKSMDAFLQKAKLNARFGWHPNTVGFCDYFRSNETAYLVQDYVDGVPFNTYWKSHGGKLNWEEARRLLKPVGEVLCKLHSAGFMNLDISPENILITRQGTSKLSLNLYQHIVDPDYDGMLPYYFYFPYERYASRARVGTFTDVYALAAIFYRAVSGIEPTASQDRFVVDSLRPLKDLVPGMPISVSDAVSRAMAMSTQDRTQTVAEFMKELEPYCTGSEKPRVQAAGVITEAIRNAQVGDHVFYGRYEQDNNLSNGPEPIEWRVLVRNGNRLLLISEYGLAKRPYNAEYKAITWENCTLRRWLNEEFYKCAFNAEEQAQIAVTNVKAEKNPYYDTNPGNDTQDRIFLLSIGEANTYFKSDEDRQCKVTVYAAKNGIYKYGNGPWWLRSPGYYGERAAIVNTDGSFGSYGEFVVSYNGFVRPALWLNL